MDRKSFIKKAGLTAAGIIAAPYILPSGRLFAATGARMVNHVVLCLFAGGVRNLESVQKVDGNLMPNMLTGTEAISGDIALGMDPLPAGPLGAKLQSFGTLYKEFRFKQGPTGHYSAHTVALTGRYTTSDLNIKASPPYPTIFELYRKHSSPEKNATNAWWVANSLGPYPALNYSSYPGYGSLYGANFIQPTSLISPEGFSALGNMKAFSTAEFANRDKLRTFLNKNFSQQYDPNKSGVTNAASDEATIRNFIDTLLTEGAAGLYANPWGAGASMNNDMYNVFFSTKIIQQFKPELMVVNMQDVDICHFNFTDYANNLRKADLAVAQLWNTIQTDPVMANDTVLIVVPEHGRNSIPNTVIDAFGRYALDHSAIGSTGGDQMSREIFCLIAGPPSVVKQNQVISSVKGESIDVVPTIARLLGFDSDIPSSVLPPGKFLSDAFL